MSSGRRKWEAFEQSSETHLEGKEECEMRVNYPSFHHQWHACFHTVFRLYLVNSEQNKWENWFLEVTGCL